ncbi:uncharacterized protein LOC125817211 [Solanum verrucosum]|uniref:uncharacterized protein LOC125817211 n=1 Tax=Solanum verrucosum TaxID=315347 RepID=UPI0020D0FEE2|nr:uncharacterized protein LOC125817211 [Solanum verrucosum]
MEKQFKLLKKSAVKTIKTIHGDIYDCVDFYKQHAFDHPLLKNHNFYSQMKPTLVRTKQNSENSSTSLSSRIWLKGKGCPPGTVPIRRITKEDLIRHRNMPSPEDATFHAQLIATNNTSELEGIYKSSQGYKVAIARAGNNPKSKFAGAEMTTSLWNPLVSDNQHSACRLKIQKGYDIVQVGWRVDPTLYGDTQTRLYIHFQAGNQQCFNTLCPGFVVVNTEIPVDTTFSGMSHRGDEASWEETMAITKDLANGNWWLYLEKNHIQIGFWPQEIFTNLASFASNVEWGGVVYSPPGVPEPLMGSSYLPIGKTGYDAYCRGLTIINDKGETIDVDRIITHVDSPNLYQIIDVPHLRPGKYQHFVLYGGPGEKAQVQI